ncbi:MAG: protein TolR [Alphaproteobacteria bacterium]
MGAQLNQRRRGSQQRMISEINVTPFVDVMLVLLIVFMVTAPLMTVGVPVDLPEAQASSINEKTEPLTISLDADGRIFIQETEIEMENLVPKLLAITGENPETRIYLRGDKSLRYEHVMKVMGTVNSAGFHKVALLAELPKPETAKG